MVSFPTVRIRPAILAQAAARAAVQLGGNFVLGVGSGEALNEHILWRCMVVGWHRTPKDFAAMSLVPREKVADAVT
jgi:hypothetical protein